MLYGFRYMPVKQLRELIKNMIWIIVWSELFTKLTINNKIPIILINALLCTTMFLTLKSPEFKILEKNFWVLTHLVILFPLWVKYSIKFSLQFLFSLLMLLLFCLFFDILYLTSINSHSPTRIWSQYVQKFIVTMA